MSTSASSFLASLLLAIDGVVSLVPAVVSQAPQHSRYSDMQAMKQIGCTDWSLAIEVSVYTVRFWSLLVFVFVSFSLVCLF